ncbi:ATP-binding cassette domain-containing protein [Rhodococcus sp. MSC1_016]|jgi:ABC-type transport system involved in cytochrome bd biosynthesis fused ATPase/permease subunit|uniref:ATP-binding cassette domain-containing protein n=1 Tax=Rhodococcus sp. MSC1_016 TaxID=2909266 RepID=UPI00202FFAF2|nr:ATP-binding cassette domain-containing protein [Rhodococcus sp. MSC1_016]
MLSVLERVVWFEVPRSGTQFDRHTNAFHLSRWQRWCDAARRDDLNAPQDERLHRSVLRALRRDVLLALLAIAFNAGCAFGAAVTLRSLIQHLVEPGTPPMVNLTLGITCILLTYSAWLALNHTFLLAELAGIGARTYIEQRLLRKKRGGGNSDRPSGVVTLMDREAARVEAAWSGLVFMILSLATLTFTSAFFFVALGLSALSALAIIVISSMAIFWIATQLTKAHTELSAISAERIDVGMFSINNRGVAWLKNWNHELIRRYADKRDGEERSLARAARLVAAINLISTLTPVVGMLAAAFTQLAYLGHVDPAGLLSAMALIGGLRSVANNVPEIAQSMSQGVVGHTNVAKYLSGTGPSDAGASAVQLPTTTAKHIAVVGAAGSGKTSILKAGARLNNRLDTTTIFVPDEPWIYPGGLYENLCLYRRDVSDDEAVRALAQSRLPDTFYAEYLESKSPPRTEAWDVSRGQGKRLELARALLAEPACVLIDQPTSGLDDDLGRGLLSSLLRGPWSDTTVVYATDKPDEIDSAEEIWVVADGAVVEVIRDLTTQSNLLPESSGWRTPDERPLPRHPSRRTDVAEVRTPSRRSLIRFGIARIAFVACVLFVCREVLTIIGDYVAASGLSTANVGASSMILVCVVAAGALLSISGALLTVRRGIGAASRQCVRYFSSIMSPTLDGSAVDQVNQDSQSKLTWDQRRVDEVLPAILLHTLGAAALLITTTGFVLSKNIFALLPCAVMCLVYWHTSRRSGNRLRYFNECEIGTTSALFARVEATTRSSSRFELARDNAVLVSWLNSSLMERALASMNNAAARRWFTYKLDLMGVLFLSAIVGSTVFVYAQGGLGLVNVLALSLSYSLIALFARLGSCLVELRQVLDSADRLLTPPLPAAPNRTCPAMKDDALVSFTDVAFVARHTGAVLLENHTESFYRRDIVVITGASGVGKSTFAKLVVGTLRPTTGVVSTLGRTTGYVSDSHDQDVLLLTSSPIFKPGRLSEHFHSPSRQELARVVRYLDAEDVVERLPSGFDEIVPSSGLLTLSKTELQRLALLDVMINPPAIAILDEATSELSAAAELSVLRALTSALPDTLFFIITHNRELARLANRIFHFNDERRLLEISGEPPATAIDRRSTDKEEVDGMATPANCIL